MQRIAVDMDGVLADTLEQFFIWDEREFGQRRKLEEILGKPESDSFPNLRSYVYSSGFFRDIPVVKDSQDVLLRLTKNYEVFIVSAATEFPQSLAEKQSWLQEHFPFISWHNIVFCGSKAIVHADIMIDDHFKNLDHFTGSTTLLFSQPHNLHSDPKKHRRVGSWKEIASILL